MTSLIKIEDLNYLTFFSGDNVDNFLKDVSKRVDEFTGDVSTTKGRDQIKSHAYSLSKAKVAIDTAGKKQVEEEKKKIKLVDSQRKKIKDGLDELRDKVREPLTRYENEEKARIAKHERVLQEIKDIGSSNYGDVVLDLEEAIKKLSQLQNRDWEEFAKSASYAITFSSDILNLAKDKAVIAAKEKEELETLRKAQQDRDEKERKYRLEVEAKAAEEAEMNRRINERKEKELAIKEKELIDARLELENQRDTRDLKETTKKTEDKAIANCEADEMRKKHIYTRTCNHIQAIADISPDKSRDIVDAILSGKIANVTMFF